MPLTKLQFKPGINRETTSSSNEGGWFDSDKIRFRFGFPEKIGGWAKYSSESFLGKCRALKAWMALDNTKYLGIGTSQKYYIEDGLTFTDITPVRETTSAGGISAINAPSTTINASINASATTISLTSVTNFAPFGFIKIGSEVIEYGSVDSTNNDLLGCTRGAKSTTASSHSSGAAVGTSTLKITDANHGVTANSFVTISGALALDDHGSGTDSSGNMSVAILNQEYQVYTVDTANANTYYINARTAETSIKNITSDGAIADTLVFSNSNDDQTGGSSIIGTYQANVGLDDSIVSKGWGAGPWNAGTWNTTVPSIDTMRIWSHDNFGEDLLLNIRDGEIAYWSKSGGTSTRAVLLSSISGANKTPTVAKQIMVSDQNRHIIVFGCDSEAVPGTQDPLLIRFGSQESLTEWETTATTTAGELRVGSGSQIIMAIETRQQILVFTDVSVHSMQHVGDPFVFGITQVAEGITVAGPLAGIAAENSVFWMGQNEFYVYAGSVQRIPCTVKDYVFSDFNKDQIEKVVASLNSAFAEIWWFYPSSSSTENDRYVVFNYEQKIWYYGNITRTAWIDRGVKNLPIAASSDNYIYSHETGFDDGSTSPSSAISAHIQSSQIDLGEGDSFVLLSKIIPDITFRDSSSSTPSANLTLFTKNFPGKNYAQNQAGTVTQSVAGTTSVVEQFTDQINLRVRGRSFSVKVESTGKETGWRLGTPKLEVRPDGRR